MGRTKGIRNKNSTKINFTCNNCQQTWLDYRCRIITKKYCSRRCLALDRTDNHFKRNERNAMWKGKLVGYMALHNWVRRRKPKPRHCKDCNNSPPHDLANISQRYKRNVDDFEWLCRKCHMIKDGRSKLLKELIHLPTKQR